MSVAVFSYSTDPKRLQVQSLDEPLVASVGKKADLVFTDVAMANETVRLLTESRNKQMDASLAKVQRSLQEMKKFAGALK